MLSVVLTAYVVINISLGMVYATEPNDVSSEIEITDEIDINADDINVDTNQPEDIIKKSVTQDDKNNLNEESEILVSDIEISEHEDFVEVGSTIGITATVLPNNASNTTITYKSSDDAIATVNSSGEVKGVKKGDVIIYVSAGDITKEVHIAVKVKTASLNVDNDYLIMKLGNTHQIVPSVLPGEANQNVTFRSTDTSVATVTDSGVVKAIGVGSSTIIVSNGDTSTAVSVIVNLDVAAEEYKNGITLDTVNTLENEMDEYSLSINASDVPVVDKELLYELYKNHEVLEIVGTGYTVTIDGKNIENYNNEFYTDIELENKPEGSSFNLNKGNYLCGNVTVHIDNQEGSYLYLYNDSKEKYELLFSPNMSELKLSSGGKYLITSKKIKVKENIVKYITYGGCVFSGIGILIYIGIKRKYWFW